jgi:hypothetical protein
MTALQTAGAALPSRGAPASIDTCVCGHPADSHGHRSALCFQWTVDRFCTCLQWAPPRRPTLVATQYRARCTKCLAIAHEATGRPFARIHAKGGPWRNGTRLWDRASVDEDVRVYVICRDCLGLSR